MPFNVFVSVDSFVMYGRENNVDVDGGNCRLIDCVYVGSKVTS